MQANIHTHTHMYNEDMKLLLHTGRMNFMFLALCIVIQLYNIDQQNAPFLN